MGIEVQSARLLLLARRLGVDFTDTLTIGRQDIFLDRRQAAGVFSEFGKQLAEVDAAAISGEVERFSPGIFKRLGAERVEHLDASAYEGATIVQDLNEPLPTDHAGSFSLVFDGGTLEHVFDVPTALRTYMQLPRINGHLILALPANNEMGHGFYQFSPELFFRILTPANGFEIIGVFLAPLFADGGWYAVADPAKEGRRVGLNFTARPLYLFVIAKRVADKIARAVPQQSDYAAEWESGSIEPKSGHVPDLRTRMKRRIADGLGSALIDRFALVGKALRSSTPPGLTPVVPSTVRREQLDPLYW